VKKSHKWEHLYPLIAKGEYSPIRHLARSLLGSKWRAGWWFVANDAITSYFDESCVDGSDRYAVIAGFVGTLDMWEGFERKYAELLLQVPDGFEDKIYQRIKPSINDEKRIEHALKVAELAGSLCLRGIATVLDTHAFQSVFPRFAKAQDASIVLSNAYSVCAFMCCGLVDAWAERTKVNAAIPIKTIFDSGGPHWNSFDRGYRKYYGQELSHTCLDPIPIQQSDETVVQLKAADQFAWSIARNWNLIEQNEILETFNKQLEGVVSFREISTSMAEDILRRLDRQEQGLAANGK
jgi:hypothetical protein